MPLVCNPPAVAVFDIFGGVSETRQGNWDPTGSRWSNPGGERPLHFRNLQESAIRLFQTMPLPLEQCPRCTEREVDLRQKHAVPAGSSFSSAPGSRVSSV